MSLKKKLIDVVNLFKIFFSNLLVEEFLIISLSILMFFHYIILFCLLLNINIIFLNMLC